MALLDGYIVAAASIDAVESVLKNLYNGSGSLARADADNDMKRMLDELDDGFQIQAQLGNRCQVERCRGYVFALTEADENAERFTVRFALLFGNERSAERAADDYDEVADFLELAQGIDIEDTEADGDFVVGRAVEEAGDDDSGSSNGNQRSDRSVRASASSPRDRLDSRLPHAGSLHRPGARHQSPCRAGVHRHRRRKPVRVRVRLPEVAIRRAAAATPL